MKKILGFLLLLSAGIAWAAPRNVTYNDLIGPASSTAAFIQITSTPTYRNCLTEVRASIPPSQIQKNITLNILDVGTTIYSVDASTGNVVQMFWNETDPFCIQPGHALVITSTATTSGTSTINVNYKGYSY